MIIVHIHHLFLLCMSKYTYNHHNEHKFRRWWNLTRQIRSKKIRYIINSFGLEAENCLYLGNELILFALRHQWQRKVTTLPPTFMSKLTRNMLQLHQYQCQYQYHKFRRWWNLTCRIRSKFSWQMATQRA